MYNPDYNSLGNWNMPGITWKCCQSKIICEVCSHSVLLLITITNSRMCWPLVSYVKMKSKNNFRILPCCYFTSYRKFLLQNCSNILPLIESEPYITESNITLPTHFCASCIFSLLIFETFSVRVASGGIALMLIKKFSNNRSADEIIAVR